MKALIIENEYDVDESIQAFLKDNPTLFESVNEQTFCAEREIIEIVPHIMKADAIIIATTFMYLDQIEEYVDAFLTGGLKDKPMVFFVHDFYYRVNEWKNKYSDEQRLRAKIIQLMENHKIYTFGELGDYDKKINDRFNIFHKLQDRREYLYFELKYSKENDVFYTDHKYETLEESIKEYNHADTN